MASLLNGRSVLRPRADRAASQGIPRGAHSGLGDADASGATRPFHRLAQSLDTPPAGSPISQTISVVVSRHAIVVRIERQGRGARGPHLGLDVRQAQVTQDAPDHRAVLNQRHELQPVRAARACQPVEVPAGSRGSKGRRHLPQVVSALYSTAYEPTSEINGATRGSATRDC